ncbi:MAG TPA: SRPBCC family protein [Actinomycetota bacterium]
MTRSDVVERQVRIDARPEIVFEFFTDPAKMIRWKGVEAKLEPQPGGVYRVVMNEAQYVANGTFVELVPHSKIVFTWGWEGSSDVPPGSSTVEVTLTPDGDGTMLRLIHSGLPVPALAAHGEGWDKFLPRLATVAAGGEVPTDA